MCPGTRVAKATSPGAPIGAVLGHEEGAAAGDALEGSEETAAAGVLGVGGHLDGLAHPGELAGLGDDGVVVIERELEDGHGGSDDAMLHVALLDDEASIPDPHPYQKCAKSSIQIV